jgi:hypothetical protein
VTKLFVDDERDPRDWLPHMHWFGDRDIAEPDDWVWAKTVRQAIEALERNDVTEVSLDHDLGEGANVGSGYDVLLWIEARAALDETYRPPVIHIHTSNTGTLSRMEAAVEGIERLVAKRARR